jgi:ammonium transporter
MDCDELESCPFVQEALNSNNADFADDATWVLTSSFVILTMQSGFGMLEMGHASPGHQVNIMLKNVFDVVFGGLAFYFVGYGIAFGHPSIPFMGLGDFFPDGSSSDGPAAGLLYSTYIFQFSFAATSTTIVSGCIAMRTKFFVYCLFSFYAVVVYAFVAHWIWAPDGWLKALGVYDMAGSGPVHLLGGTNGLVAILFVGPRLGRFDGKRQKSDFKPISPCSILLGLFILWWGWVGFNCGSSFGITGKKWMVATRAAVSTINSSVGGGVVALLYTQLRSKGKRVCPGHVANGILGSLVSITAGCACVHTYEALVIGSIGAALALIANDVVELKCKLDDPVGGVGVHFVGGMWGVLAVGLFADGSLPGIHVENGLFRGGGFRLLGVQMLSVVSIIGWSLTCMLPFFYLAGVALSREWRDPRKGLRVLPEEEIFGPDHGLHDVMSEERATEIRMESQHFLRHTLESRHGEDDSLGDSEERELEEARKISVPDESPRQFQHSLGPKANRKGTLLVSDL